MPYEFIPMFWILFLFLGCWGLILIGRNIKVKSRLKESEMNHRERIEAMQQGQPVPESTASPAAPDSTYSPARVSSSMIHWFRAVSLALGFFFLFTGVGMCLAFSVVEEFREIWSIGMIPAMAGIGFLLFFTMSRDLASKMQEA